MEVSPDTLGKLAPIAERYAAGFVAAFFALAFAWLLLRYVGEKKEHAKELAKLHESFEAKLEKIHAGELQRAVRMETTMRGFEELVEGLLTGGVRVRRGKPTTDPGLREDSPTLNLRLPTKGEGDAEG